MNSAYEMLVEDVFQMADGQTVFVGPVTGNANYLGSGLYELFVDNELRGVLRIEGEMISFKSRPRSDGRRALSSRDTRCIDKDSILPGRRWVLRPKRDLAHHDSKG